MGNAYPKELRERAVRTHIEDGVPVKETARLFKLGYSTLRRWIAEFKRDGRLAPLPDSGGRAALEIFKKRPEVRARMSWTRWTTTQHPHDKNEQEDVGYDVLLSIESWRVFTDSRSVGLQHRPRLAGSRHHQDLLNPE